MIPYGYGLTRFAVGYTVETLYGRRASKPRNKYCRIKARRSHKKAIIAICRMILTVIWHILTDLKPYTLDGFFESRPVNKEKVLTASQALDLLKQRGYLIKDDPLPAS